MRIYKVELFGGYCGLIAAESLGQAMKQALSDEGRSNVQAVVLASREDVAWVRGMGGRVPEGKTA